MEKIKKLLQDPKIAKYQTMIISFAAVLICTLIIGFFIVPQIYTILDTNKKISDIENRRDKLAKKLSEVESLNVSEYSRDLSASFIALPEDREIPEVIGQILSLLSSTGLTLEDIAFSTPIADPTGVSSYNASISVTGDESSIQTLFSKIKENPRIMRVGKLEINASSSISKSQADIDIAIYFQPLPSKIGDVEQPIILLNPEEKELLTNLANTKISNFQSSSSESASPIGKQDPFN